MDTALLPPPLAQDSPPKIVFVVPYRSRPQHKYFFSSHMSLILRDRTDYELYFAHQADSRPFNRGAARNLGFLAVKAKYPNAYKQMTFVFNDVDTMPFANIFDYDTVFGQVKHFYGVTHTLGGIVSIKGLDFESSGGYPHYWGWGMEDNAFQTRCLRTGLRIDRSHFRPLGHPDMLQLFDGLKRTVSRDDPWREKHDDGHDGLHTISNLRFTIDPQSSNREDNVYSIPNDRFMYVNATWFDVPVPPGPLHEYDLRDPPRKIRHPSRAAIEDSARMFGRPTVDWTDLSHKERDRPAVSKQPPRAQPSAPRSRFMM